MGGKSIIVAADEPIGCPNCGHGFPLSEGISRQAIERHAEEHDRALAAEKRRLETRCLGVSPSRTCGKVGTVHKLSAA
jgi:hypothetical protein